MVFSMPSLPRHGHRDSWRRRSPPCRQRANTRSGYAGNRTRISLSTVRSSTSIPPRRASESNENMLEIWKYLIWYLFGTTLCIHSGYRAVVTFSIYGSSYYKTKNQSLFILWIIMCRQVRKVSRMTRSLADDDQMNIFNSLNRFF